MLSSTMSGLLLGVPKETASASGTLTVRGLGPAGMGEDHAAGEEVRR